MFHLFQIMNLKKNDDSLMVTNLSNGTGNQLNRKKIFIAGGSLLNGINEKSLSKNHSVKVKNIPGGASDVISDELDNFLKNNPDSVIVHAGTLQRGKCNESR